MRLANLARVSGSSDRLYWFKDHVNCARCPASVAMKIPSELLGYPISPSSPAAVDEQARAGDEGGGGRGEEDDRRGDLLDCAEATQWDAVEHPFAEHRVVEKRL